VAQDLRVLLKVPLPILAVNHTDAFLAFFDLPLKGLPLDLQIRLLLPLQFL